MTASNMAAITESLERSLQNCSLDTHRNGVAISGESRRSFSSSSSSSSSSAAPENRDPQRSETTLELNSDLSLPYHWEQCLDLKTGEVYYINWTNGMKAKEDPRTNINIMTEYNNNGDLYEGEILYDSEESSSESSPSPSSSREQYQGDHVLVVAGCKSCLMYFMVPKQVEDCPKCDGLLLRFDRSETSSP